MNGTDSEHLINYFRNKKGKYLKLDNGEKVKLEYKDTFQIYDIKNDKIYRFITGYGEDIDGIFDDFINENL